MTVERDTLARNAVDFVSITKRVGIRQKTETHSDYYGSCCRRSPCPRTRVDQTFVVSAVNQREYGKSPRLKSLNLYYSGRPIYFRFDLRIRSSIGFVRRP